MNAIEARAMKAGDNSIPPGQGIAICELAPIFKCRFCGKKIYTNHWRHYHVEGCKEEIEANKPVIVRIHKNGENHAEY